MGKMLSSSSHYGNRGYVLVKIVHGIAPGRVKRARVDG
jgi:hypothetical protein